jgi:hypothetical protein
LKVFAAKLKPNPLDARRVAQDRFCSMALFSNSVGQPSTCADVGQQWDGVLDNPKCLPKYWLALFIYDNKGQYQHKIPFNDYGIAGFKDSPNPRRT